ncbi:hypothetical protein BaRGS_00029019, partial [Batillaria attramentaria]
SGNYKTVIAQAGEAMTCLALGCFPCKLALAIPCEAMFENLMGIMRFHTACPWRQLNDDDNPSIGNWTLGRTRADRFRFSSRRKPTLPQSDPSFIGLNQDLRGPGFADGVIEAGGGDPRRVIGSAGKKVEGEGGGGGSVGSTENRVCVWRVGRDGGPQTGLWTSREEVASSSTISFASVTVPVGVAGDREASVC